jgi:hypothetical protein
VEDVNCKAKKWRNAGAKNGRRKGYKKEWKTGGQRTDVDGKEGRMEESKVLRMRNFNEDWWEELEE